MVGLIIAVTSLLSSFILPFDMAIRALKLFTLPVLILYPVGIFIYGRVIVGAQRKYRMESELMSLNSELEELVKVRTAQVGDVNRGLVEEIQMRKQTEEALKEAEKVANSANKMKSDFLANMSHEIRTPLNAIIGYTHLLDKTDLNEKQKNFVAKMDSSSANLLNIVNDILDFSKIEAGKVDYEPRPVNLYRLYDKLMDTISFESLKKELSLDITLEESAPEWVISDENHYSQVMLNVMANAVKFTHKGGVSINVKIIDEEGKVYIRTVIEDTGIGVKKRATKYHL